MTSLLERLLGVSLFLFYIALAVGIVCLVAETIKAFSSRKHLIRTRKSN